MKAVKLAEIEWTKDPVTKRYSAFTENPNTEFLLECDLAFLAMGFVHVEQKGLVEDLEISLDPCGNLIGNDTEYRTNQDKIFSCGDARRG